MAEEEVPPTTQFRELDDEFLQKQARIWLEAVLEERYEENQSLSDLLANGDILYRVSKAIKELIRKRSDGEVSTPVPESTADGKGGKYLPYSNVDSFLSVCKRIGLPDLDLFSPPDVVEKKDIRRVCVCIRALSKKAQAKQLEVPDFDNVVHTVSMPTVKVGGIREYLQQAAITPDVKTPRTVGRIISSQNLALLNNSNIPQLSNGTNGGENSELTTPSVRNLEETMLEPIDLDRLEPVGSSVENEDLEDSVSDETLPPEHFTSNFAEKMEESEESPSTPASSTSSTSTSSSSVSSPSVYEDPIGAESQINSQGEPSTAQETQSSENKIFTAEGGTLKDVEASGSQEEMLTTRPSLPYILPQEPSIVLKENPYGSQLHNSIDELLPNQGTFEDKDLLEEKIYVEETPVLKNDDKPSVQEKGDLANSASRKSPDFNNLWKNSFWVPVAAGVVAFLGALLSANPRAPSCYEVREGDTLSAIARRTGKSGWKELAQLNPQLKNPDLIYPSERLKLCN